MGVQLELSLRVDDAGRLGGRIEIKMKRIPSFARERLPPER